MCQLSSHTLHEKYFLKRSFKGFMQLSFKIKLEEIHLKKKKFRHLDSKRLLYYLFFSNPLAVTQLLENGG